MVWPLFYKGIKKPKLLACTRPWGSIPYRERKKQTESLLLVWPNYTNNFVKCKGLRLDWLRIKVGHVCTCAGPVTNRIVLRVPQSVPSTAVLGTLRDTALGALCNLNYF